MYGHTVIKTVGYEQQPLAIGRNSKRMVEMFSVIALRSETPNEAAIRTTHHNAMTTVINDEHVLIVKYDTGARIAELTFGSKTQKLSVLGEDLTAPIIAAPTHAVEQAHSKPSKNERRTE